MDKQVEFAELDPSERELEDEAEFYFRQCHPSFYDAEVGHPTSQMLGDFPVDKGKLSGSRSSKRTALEAHLDFPGKSVGTWGVTVGEVISAGCRIVDDSALPTVPYGHAYLDTRHFHGRKAERKRATSRILIAMHKEGKLAP